MRVKHRYVAHVARYALSSHVGPLAFVISSSHALILPILRHSIGQSHYLSNYYRIRLKWQSHQLTPSPAQVSMVLWKKNSDRVDTTRQKNRRNQRLFSRFLSPIHTHLPSTLPPNPSHFSHLFDPLFLLLISSRVAPQNAFFFLIHRTSRSASETR